MDKGKLDDKMRRMLNQEISTMEAIHHPNLIRLYEVVETYSKLYLVMEYASGGELYNRVTTCGKLEEVLARQLFAQICSAVNHMVRINFSRLALTNKFNEKKLRELKDLSRNDVIIFYH